MGGAAGRRVARRGSPGLHVSLADVSATSGLDLVNVSGGPAKDYIVDANGNGAALFDYDNDGDLDALLVNGSTRERLPRGGDADGGPLPQRRHRPVHRRHRGQRLHPHAAGAPAPAWPTWTTTASRTSTSPRSAPTSSGATPARARSPTSPERPAWATPRWSTSCAFNDYDHDGFVDLYVANYVKFDDKAIPARATTASCRFMATDVFCGPNRLAGEPDVLYRNNGDGTFTDVTARAGIADPGYYGFGVVFADLTGDGWPDIYVANDSVPNLFFRNTGKGTFVEEGLPAGVAVSGDGRPQAGMGVDAGDYNGDGLPDLVVTNFSHDYNTLYENGPPGVFTDRSYAAGIAVTAGPYLGLGREAGGPRQRRAPRPVHRQRPRLSRCGRPRPRHRLPAAQAGVPQRRAAVPRRDRRRLAAACCSSDRAAAPPSATSTTTATPTSWSST